MDEEPWEALSADEQWEAAVAGLRKESGLEWKPDGWAEFRFAGPSAFDLLSQAP